MKTFTIRDISRKTADVFHTVDVEGSVHVLARDGRTYVIHAERSEAGGSGNFDIRRRLFLEKKVPRQVLERNDARDREER